MIRWSVTIRHSISYMIVRDSFPNSINSMTISELSFFQTDWALKIFYFNNVLKCILWLRGIRFRSRILYRKWIAKEIPQTSSPEELQVIINQLFLKIITPNLFFSFLHNHLIIIRLWPSISHKKAFSHCSLFSFAYPGSYFTKYLGFSFENEDILRKKVLQLICILKCIIFTGNCFPPNHKYLYKFNASWNMF